MAIGGSAGDDVLIGEDVAEEIYGLDGDDFLDGRGGGDQLYGGAGEDILVGATGSGDDLYDGGAGRDLLTYYDASAGVRVDLSTGEARSLLSGDAAEIGIDRIFNIEDVEGTPFDDYLIGSAGDNVLMGMEGNDTLAGGLGNDLLVPGLGNDVVNGGSGYDTVDYSAVNHAIYISLAVSGSQNTGAGRDSFVSIEHIIGGQFGDVLSGSTASNQLRGLGGNDRLSGGAGNDTLDGGAGADRMTGGVGNDTFHVDSAADLVSENAGEGVDTVVSTISYVLGQNLENLTVTAVSKGDWEDGEPIDGLLTLTGNSLANTLRAAGGANLLDGGAGADRMYGGDGNDTYIVDNTGDVVIEYADSNAESNPDAGLFDEVRASVSFTLSANVEVLELQGTSNINGTGNAGDNLLIGNSGANRLYGRDGSDQLEGGSGNDLLDGGTGDDFLFGGTGNDTFLVDSSNDMIAENYGEGVDTVQASASYWLYANGWELENLVLTGTASISGSGNELANRLTGNSGANLLEGLSGSDRLYGQAGADTLYGGEGSDAIEGGSGRDFLWGGADDDFFYFRNGDFGGATAATADVIQDFSRAEGDRISLALADANGGLAGDQAFAFIGTNAFTGTAGELRYEQIGGNTYVSGDINGDGVADFMINVQGLHTLGSGDFVL